MSSRKPIRDLPAYQEYASDALANRHYRAMSMAERGLWDTLRKECWVNGSVPAEKALLAKFLGIKHAELESLLTQHVLWWFVINETEMRCIELDAYREDQRERKQAQIDGGKKGGLNAQGKNRVRADPKSEEKAEANLEGGLKVLRGDEQRGDEQRGVEQRGVEQRGVEQRGDEQRGDEQRGVEQRGVEQRGVEQRGVESLRKVELSSEQLEWVKAYGDEDAQN